MPGVSVGYPSRNVVPAFAAHVGPLLRGVDGASDGGVDALGAHLAFLSVVKVACAAVSAVLFG